MRRTYTEKDQAFVAVTLKVNQGNVKRTARETGVPIQTVRDWKQKWEREGYPEALEEALPAVVLDVISEMVEVRNLALDILKQKLREGKPSARDAAWIVGVLTDKINLAKGLATSRTETLQVALPDTKELARELAAFVAASVDAAKQRTEEIEDADWEEVARKALPTAS